MNITRWYRPNIEQTYFIINQQQKFVCKHFQNSNSFFFCFFFIGWKVASSFGYRIFEALVRALLMKQNCFFSSLKMSNISEISDHQNRDSDDNVLSLYRIMHNNWINKCVESELTWPKLRTPPLLLLLPPRKLSKLPARSNSLTTLAPSWDSNKSWACKSVTQKCD